MADCEVCEVCNSENLPNGGTACCYGTGCLICEDCICKKCGDTCEKHCNCSQSEEEEEDNEENESE